MDKKAKIRELNLEAAIRQVAESYSDEAAQLASSRSEIRKLRAAMKALVASGTTMIERFDRIIGDKEDS